MTFQAVVLAAGKGRRLGRLTENRSKAMQPIAGKPVAARVCDQLVEAGVGDVILVVKPDDSEIGLYFKKYFPHRVALKIVEQRERLGTAGALLAAAEYIRGGFLLSACDSIVSAQDIKRLVARSGQGVSGVLALMRVPQSEIGRRSAVQLAGSRVVSITEKPAERAGLGDIASLPLYLFSPEILPLLKDIHRSSRGEFELQDAIQRLIDLGGRVEGVFIEARLELTTVDDLLALNLHYLALDSAAGLGLAAEYGAAVEIHPPVNIESGVEIGTGAHIGPLVFLETGCLVGERAHLRESVVLRGAQVPPGTIINREVVAGG